MEKNQIMGLEMSEEIKLMWLNLGYQTQYNKCIYF